MADVASVEISFAVRPAPPTEREGRIAEILARVGVTPGTIGVASHRCLVQDLARLRPIPLAPTEREERDEPRVVCLCGSTRFYREYQIANFDLTMAGAIVLSVGFYPHSDEHHEEIGLADAEDAEAKKVELDELHLRKIDLADEVLVICPGGYIGDSTGREIKYAEQAGKPVTYRRSFPKASALASPEEPDEVVCSTCGERRPRDPVGMRGRPEEGVGRIREIVTEYGEGNIAATAALSMISGTIGQPLDSEEGER